MPHSVTDVMFYVQWKRSEHLSLFLDMHWPSLNKNGPSNRNKITMKWVNTNYISSNRTQFYEVKFESIQLNSIQFNEIHLKLKGR